eukprot:scaffold5359_cov112-Skeletonema_marinoi.AAC.3
MSYGSCEEQIAGDHLSWGVPWGKRAHLPVRSAVKIKASNFKSISSVPLDSFKFTTTLIYNTLSKAALIINHDASLDLQQSPRKKKKTAVRPSADLLLFSRSLLP